MCVVWGSEGLGCEVCVVSVDISVGGIRWEDADSPASGSDVLI